MSRITNWSTAALATTVLSSPLYGQPPEPPQLLSSRHDSSGVEIVEYSQKLPSSLTFALQPRPALAFSRWGNQPGQVETSVPFRAIRLANGQIVVAGGAGGLELAFIDSAGVVLRTVGGGSARTVVNQICRMPGDSILVSEATLRVSVFSPAGTLVQVLRRSPGTEYLCPAHGALRFLRTDLAGPRLGRGAVLPPREQRVQRRPYRITTLADGAKLATGSDLGTFLGDEIRLTLLPNSLGQDVVVGERYPFGRPGLVAADGERFHVADGGAWEVRTYSVTGQLTRILRVMSPLDEITPEVRAAYVEAELGHLDAVTRQQVIRLRELETPEGFPGHIPPFGEMLVDAAGRLWLQQYPRPGATLQRWWVFGARGDYQGVAEFTARFIPRMIGSDFVLGSYQIVVGRRPSADGLRDGAQYEVRMYRLERSGGQ